jgi:hypothetical protein
MNPFPAELGGMGAGLRSGAAGVVSGFFSASLEKSAFNASTAKPMNSNGAIGGMFGLPFIIQLENPPLFCNCKQNRPLNGNAREAAAARWQSRFCAGRRFASLWATGRNISLAARRAF